MDTEIVCKKIPSQDGMQDYFIAIAQRPRKVPFLRRIIEARIDRKKEKPRITED